MAPAAILDFEIRVFGSMHLLDMWSGWYMWSLTVLGSADEKLLRFLFSIGNALEVPKIGVLGDFRGQNWNMYLSEPQKAPPCAQTRVLTYYSPKSVHNCDVWIVSSYKPEIVYKWNFKMAAGGHLVYKNVRVLTRHLMGGAYMMQIAENGANRIIRLEVI